MKIVLTAFHGLLKSEPQDLEPQGKRLYLDQPFVRFGIGIGELLSRELSPRIMGSFKSTGRLIGGVEEWALESIR